MFGEPTDRQGKRISGSARIRQQIGRHQNQSNNEKHYLDARSDRLISQCLTTRRPTANPQYDP